MKRWRLFLLLLAALSLALAQGAEAKQHRGGMGGKSGKKKSTMDGGKKKAAGPSASENPMSSGASRETHERSGLIETGLRPVYPDSAECLEVKSHFASPTRFDGSLRVSRAYHGYHNGFDISSPIGTPLIAIANGEVVHKYTGGRLVGNQIFIRHAPEDTGLAVWVYSKYKHFDKLPDLEIGQRVKMGQYLGPSGDTGTAGGYFQAGYPHLHMSIYATTSPKYGTGKKSIKIKNVRQLDPVALFLKKDPPVLDSHSARDLPDSEKDVPIAYITTDGKAVPEGARIVWPFACKSK